MGTVFFAIVSVVAVSLVSLIGVLTISIDEARVRSMANSQSASRSALLGDAFIHLIPEIFKDRVSSRASSFTWRTRISSRSCSTTIASALSSCKRA